MLEMLIPARTLKKLTEDSNSIDFKKILCLGVIFHDIGMFVSRIGLSELIQKDKWQKEWADYVKAKGRALNQGPDPANDLTPLTAEESFIQDFIRKNHPDLSYEFVVNGFPLLSQTKKEFDCFEDFYPSLNKEQRLLVANLAKVHGAKDLQDMKKEPGWPRKESEAVKMEYLVAMLRLADTLDIGKKRANPKHAQTTGFNDPQSYVEYKFHENVTRPKKVDRKPELRIEFEPNDTETLIMDNKLVAKAQRELQAVLATIGKDNYSELGTRINRIRSNEDRGEEAREELKKRFLTEEASIKVDPNLFTSLAGPLYSNDIYCGIRELIQNAVDACRAREKQDPPGTPKPTVKVEIDTRGDKSYITVTDTGIGMDADTIVDYYLVAGAKYRENKDWMEANIDESGNTKIVRSGRFGIGVLAGFLLGNTIKVSTRHVSDTNPYVFEVYKKGNCSANFDHEQEAEIGTTICIELGDDQKAELAKSDIARLVAGNLNEWQERSILRNLRKWTRWYYPSEPQIEYIWNGINIREAKPEVLLEHWPALNDESSEPLQTNPWGEPLKLYFSPLGRLVTDPSAQAHIPPVYLYWRLTGHDLEERDYSSYRSSQDYYYKLNGTVCHNGIRLSDGAQRAGETVHFIEDIDISIVDKNSQFDLALARDSAIRANDVEDAINQAIVKRYDHGDIKQTIQWIKNHVQDGQLPGAGANKVLIRIIEQLGFGEQLWRVLWRQNDKVLLVSELAFPRAYDEKGQKSSNNWADSTLKEYLNEVWVEEKLPGYIEKGFIADPELGNLDDTNPDSKVFVLSIEQVGAYFSGDFDRQSFVVGDHEWAFWWLRSPGVAEGFAAYVYPGGGVYPFGIDVGNRFVGVRPAFWLNLEG